jgi:hypothetical protein
MGTPGDIEHKVPSSKNRRLHFVWSNLTVACTECNRRKLDYYEIGAEFLDPYSDPVEDCLIHLGPIVYLAPGHQRAEITVRTLSLVPLSAARSCNASVTYSKRHARWLNWLPAVPAMVSPRCEKTS